MRIGHRFHALVPPREREFLAFIRRTGPNDTHDGDQAVDLAHVAHAAQAGHRGRFDMMHRPCAATGDHLPHLRVLPRLLLTPSLSPSALRHIESPLLSFRMYWALGPTPSPSQEGSPVCWPVPLLGGVRGGLIGDKFVESSLSFSR